ncbi:MAG TPA: hypothetical protein VNH44_05380 [Micropepsaceae bacterium]|nr:hypothetical protein [Micropepsaceae bacterium]
MAGFDVIGEMSLDTLSDFINSQPIPMDGQTIYLFGGKFEMNLAAGDDIPPAEFVCVASLESVVRTSTCRLVMALSDGAMTFGSKSLYHLGATATVSVIIDWIPDPDTHGQIVPAILLSKASASVALDAYSSQQVDGAIGAGMSKFVNIGLGLTLQDWVRGLGDRPVPAFSFALVPGQDSDDPATVTAKPSVSWIDATTLGVFGYYRAAASGGNVNAKTDSDIVQPHQEFVYNQPGALSIVPARRIAVLMSPAGFHLTIACPLIKNSLIRQFVYQQMIGDYLARVRATQYQTFYGQALAANFVNYFNAAMVKFMGNGPANAAAEAFNLALQDVANDADAAVAAEAATELNNFLDSAAGQQMILGATPPSCGNGSVEVHREHMADPLRDLVVNLTKMSIDLDKGFIRITAGAGGSLPLCGGFSVTQTGELSASVNALGCVVPAYNLDQPKVDISADPICEAGTAALLSFFTGASWGAFIAFGGITLATAIADGIAQSMMFAKETGALAGLPAAQSLAINPNLPQNAELKDIIIDPTALTTIALVGRDYHIDDFRPRFEVDASLVSSVSTRPTTLGRYHVDATKWGCKAHDFQYTRHYYETVFALRLVVIDLPLPVTIDRWTIQLGNFYYTLPGVPDPRPLWSNEFRTLAAPQVMLAGDCWFPVPPLLGQFQTKDTVAVGVSGSADGGWQLSFRSQDGNFFVQVGVEGHDGNGAFYSASTFFHVSGDLISLGFDYWNYKAACDKLFEQWVLAEFGALHPFGQQARVQPGQPVENPESFVAQVVGQAVQANDPAAFALMQSAVARYGAQFLKRVGAGRVAGGAPNAPSQLT